MKFLKVALLSFLVSPTLDLGFAQTATTDHRSIYVPIYQPGLPDVEFYGNLVSPANPGSGFASVEWRYVPPSNPGATPVIHSATLPMHRVGDIVRVTTTDFLVVGERFTSAPAFTGHLARVHIDFQTQGVSVVSANDIGSMDPVAISHDWMQSRLYVLDAGARRLVAAPWATTSALPSSFSTVFDYTALPALQRPTGIRLASSPDAVGVRVYEGNNVVYTVCSSVNGQWTQNTTAWQSSLRQPVVTAARRFVPLNRPWDLQVFGAASFPISGLVKSESQADVPVYLTSATPSISPLAVTSTPGDCGSLSITEGKAFDFRTCVRYGMPQNTSFYPFGEVTCDMDGPFAGRQNMLIVADVLPHATHGTTQAPAIGGELRIGFRGANGVDPVTVNGTDATLTPAMALPFTVPGGDLPRDISFAIPTIPPELAGMVALFQIVVTDGTQFAKTDVFGMQIRSSTPYVLPN